jgi:hypothetical protein
MNWGMKLSQIAGLITNDCHQVSANRGEQAACGPPVAFAEICESIFPFSKMRFNKMVNVVEKFYEHLLLNI